LSTPVIETERLVLRGFTRADFDAFAGFFADDVATRFVGGTMPRPRAHTVMSAFAGQWELYGLGQWAVEPKEGGGLAGFVGYINPPDWPEPELGWTILPAFQGRGYATESSRAARAEMVRLGAPVRLVSYIDPDNAPSVRVAEKLGAQRGGMIDLRGMHVDVWRHPELTREGGLA
jgi:RimJ/RimL family protein N-acetyltransferase